MLVNGISTKLKSTTAKSNIFQESSKYSLVPRAINFKKASTVNVVVKNYKKDGKLLIKFWHTIEYK